MEMIFLGTSAGVPTKARNVSGLALKKQSDKAWTLIDCGEGTQHQLLHTKLSLNRLSAILITHVHGDHCYGLPGLLASAAMSGREQPLLIVAPSPISGFLESIQALIGLQLPYRIDFIDVESATQGIGTNDFYIEPVALSHGVASHGYVFTEKGVERKLDKQCLVDLGVQPGPVWGRLQQGEDVRLDNGMILKSEDFLRTMRRARKVIVAGDNDKPELLAAACRQADVLVHEATYTRDAVERIGTSHQHSTAGSVAEVACNSALTNLVLTHFSPRYQYARRATPADTLSNSSNMASIQGVEDEARRAYSGNLFLANDFDTYHLSRDGWLTRQARTDRTYQAGRHERLHQSRAVD